MGGSSFQRTDPVTRMAAGAHVEEELFAERKMLNLSKCRCAGQVKCQVLCNFKEQTDAKLSSLSVTVAKVLVQCFDWHDKQLISMRAIMGKLPLLKVKMSNMRMYRATSFCKCMVQIQSQIFAG